ncbi:hypothetical protein N7510_004458 [Penicillium lagena]|uniref:uncharacterized protein n=1 Tax=Penicillium lagena TaxID=94218 RepID=UPI00253F8B84|nr:uncharacterized protein N7510_004458 [Penicillium lagena]KAJ5620474.1 hypothetical protein N7510_004458 [Penicillium lagena]
MTLHEIILNIRQEWLLGLSMLRIARRSSKVTSRDGDPELEIVPYPTEYSFEKAALRTRDEEDETDEYLVADHGPRGDQIENRSNNTSQEINTACCLATGKCYLYLPLQTVQTTTDGGCDENDRLHEPNLCSGDAPSPSFQAAFTADPAERERRCINSA